MSKKLGFERATSEINRAGATITSISRNKRKVYWRKGGYTGYTDLDKQKSYIMSKPTRKSRLRTLKMLQRKAGR